MLFISIWEIESRVLKDRKFIAGTKFVAFILPAFQTILINLPPITSIPILHLSIEIGISKFYYPVAGSYGIHPLTYKPRDSGHYSQRRLYFYGSDSLQMFVCQVGFGLDPKGQSLG